MAMLTASLHMTESASHCLCQASTSSMQPSLSRVVPLTSSEAMPAMMTRSEVT